MYTIRQETPADYRRTEEITRDAFWNLYCPGASEHWLLHNMRTHKDYIPGLALVLEQDGEIAGCIYYTHAQVKAADGRVLPLVSFGPVAIAPALQGRGLGEALITHSMAEARRLGHRAVVIGGFPGYYHRFGFAGTKRYGIRAPDGQYYTGFMALPLAEGALDNAAGTLYFSEAMELGEKEGLAGFDAGFPPKEKAVQPSQAAFEKAVAELDTAE